VSAASPTGQPEHRGPDGDAGGWGYFVAVVVVSTVGTGVPVVSILGVSFAAGYCRRSGSIFQNV